MWIKYAIYQGNSLYCYNAKQRAIKCLFLAFMPK